MQNRLQPSMGNSFEHNEQACSKASPEIVPSGMTEEQIFLDYLLEMGFEWEEATQLIVLRYTLHQNAEMSERRADDYRMHFARWLYEQGEINEK